ncbi:unnamed protein product [Auanema sp. JU1783]|nr:unnamed protein product [Auanema sp. JU1783]
MAFRRVLILSKLFTKSWGHPNTLKQLSKHRKEVMSQRGIQSAIDSLDIDFVIEKEKVKNGVRILEGRFRSPHSILYPEQMPGPLRWARWKGIFPQHERRGLCIHLAGTGDHSYVRREIGFANDMLRQNQTASIMLQNPFYMDRKPPEQYRSSLLNVSDLFVMGAALMSECNYILNWARKEGYGPLAIAGVSMGGFMASLAGSNMTFPVSIIPILSWTTASLPYTRGAIAGSINYYELERLIEDPNYISKIKSIPDTDWVDRMHEMTAKNGKSLSYNFMCILMDEFTLLSNYPTPLNTSLCNAIVAENDAYVLRDGAPDFQDIWPGMTLEVMPGVGHVEAYLTGHALWRKRIAETMDRTPKPI